MLIILNDQVDQLKIELGCKPFFLRGDINNSGAVDQVDVIDIVNWLNGKPLSIGGAPTCVKAADVNDDGHVDQTDATSLLTFLYFGGTPPKPPFPLHGTDPTTDSLPCETQPAALAGV